MANFSDLTRKEQVLTKLRERPGEWIDGAELATEEVGGSEGLKRLRELKAEGWLIQMRRKPAQGSDQFQYRIAVQLRTDGTLGYYDPTLHPEDHERKEEIQNGGLPTRTPDRRGDPASQPVSPQPKGGGFWGSHATDRATNRKAWREWKPAKKAPGTLECVFWIGKQRVIGAIGQLGPDKWGWGVVVPGSTKKMTRERRIGHGNRPTKDDAREAVEELIEQMRDSGEYR